MNMSRLATTSCIREGRDPRGSPTAAITSLNYFIVKMGDTNLLWVFIPSVGQTNSYAERRVWNSSHSPWHRINLPSGTTWIIR